MQFVFDENVSHRVVQSFKEQFSDSIHISEAGIGDSPKDAEIWAYAKRMQATIVTRDDDFFQLSLKHGFPPKVIILRIGNMKKVELASFLKKFKTEIQDFIQNEEMGLLELHKQA